MRGSFDNPPIVVGYPAWKAKLWVGGSAVFLLICLFVALPLSPPIGLVFGPVAAILLWGSIRQLRAPPFVEISPKGIYVFDDGDTADLAWADIEEIRFVRASSGDFIIYNLFSSAQKRHAGGLRGLLAIEDGHFPTGLEISQEDLADLLNAAKDRWGVATQTAAKP